MGESLSVVSPSDGELTPKNPGYVPEKAKEMFGGVGGVWKEGGSDR